MLPDGTQKLLSICFEFLGPNAGQPAQLRQRFGARGGHLAQSGIVEDDVGRDLGFLGHFLAQGPKRFEQRITDRIGCCIGPSSESGSSLTHTPRLTVHQVADVSTQYGDSKFGPKLINFFPCLLVFLLTRRRRGANCPQLHV